MKRTFELALLCLLLPVNGFAADTFANGWWQKDSPELVLSNAQAVTRSLAFFHAERTGSTSSEITNPFAKTNANSRVEFFQRRNGDGSVESKKFVLDGTFQWTDYRLKDGNYVFTLGQIIKKEFADGEDFEQSVAAQFDHPYEYKLLKPEVAGTSDCVVVARCMTPKFLNAMKAIYYKNYTKEQEDAFGGDFRKFIRSETDFYIRESDAVTIGYIQRNYLGEQLGDWLYDKIEINQPIPGQEFSLPKGKIKIAKSSDDEKEIIGALRAARLANSRQGETAMLSERRVAELPWAADLPKALEQAKSGNKIVLLDFTGSDWCVWCMKFDDDVLSKPGFAAYAKSNLVMVLLDFPNAKKQSDALKKANADLQARFKVDGFPTYVALNSDGKEIGRQIGYLSGGPQAFIVELEKFRKQ